MKELCYLGLFFAHLLIREKMLISLYKYIYILYADKCMHVEKVSLYRNN